MLLTSDKENMRPTIEFSTIRSCGCCSELETRDGVVVRVNYAPHVESQIDGAWWCPVRDSAKTAPRKIERYSIAVVASLPTIAPPALRAA